MYVNLAPNQPLLQANLLHIPIVQSLSEAATRTSVPFEAMSGLFFGWGGGDAETITTVNNDEVYNRSTLPS